MLIIAAAVANAAVAAATAAAATAVAAAVAAAAAAVAAVTAAVIPGCCRTVSAIPAECSLLEQELYGTLHESKRGMRQGELRPCA